TPLTSSCTPLNTSVATPSRALSAATCRSGRDHARSRFGDASPEAAFTRRVIGVLLSVLPAWSPPHRRRHGAVENGQPVSEKISRSAHVGGGRGRRLPLQQHRLSNRSRPRCRRAVP